MAFVSQRNISGHVKGPSIRFRQTKSGAGGGTISKAAPFRGERIDIQVCEESRRVRIGIDQRGVSCGAAGQFSCSLNVYRIVGDKRIDITDGGDGWWYGNY
ncbi:hypothetical protein E0X15_12585 [Salmonella enterica subsp. enterica serovar Gatuni]|nr:hypothetical protein [Salmonella enterica subsp. enterica serovar Gatuni]